MKSKDQTTKTLFIIVSAAILIRLAFGLIFFAENGTSSFGDDWDYISYAKNILDQGISVPDISKLHSNSHLVGPGFPLILSVLFYIFGENYLIVILLNVLVSSLSVILIFYIGKEVFNKQVGLMAAGWSAFYFLFIRYIPTVLKEVWVAFLFPLAVYLFILETKRDGISWKSIFFILAYSFLIHMDERYFVYFPLITIFFLYLDRINWRNGVKKATLFFVTVCVLMIPWLIRNYYVYNHRIVILTERTAKFTDKIFGYDSELSHYGKKAKKYSQFEWKESMIDDILEGKEIKGLSGKRYKRLQAGLKYGLIPHAHTNLEKWYTGFKEFWRPCRVNAGYIGSGFRFERPWSLRSNLIRGITYGLLLPFLVIGIFLIFKYRDRRGIFLVTLIFVHSFMHIVLGYTRNRYRIPIDAFIIIIAFYSLLQLYTLLKNRVRLYHE